MDNKAVQQTTELETEQIRIPCIIFKVVGICIIVAVFFVFSTFCKHELNKLYDNAVSLYNQGQYEEAYKEFCKLTTFKDSAEYADRLYKVVKFNEGIKFMESEEYIDAINIFSELDDYSSSEMLLKECVKLYAKELAEE